MDSLESSAKKPDFDAMIQKVIEKWRTLPSDTRNDRNVIESLLESFYGFFLDSEDRDFLEGNLNTALAQEGYTGEPFEALNETRRIIGRCVMEEFIRL